MELVPSLNRKSKEISPSVYTQMKALWGHQGGPGRVLRSETKLAGLLLWNFHLPESHGINFRCLTLADYSISYGKLDRLSGKLFCFCFKWRLTKLPSDFLFLCMSFPSVITCVCHNKSHTRQHIFTVIKNAFLGLVEYPFWMKFHLQITKKYKEKEI